MSPTCEACGAPCPERWSGTVSEPHRRGYPDVVGAVVCADCGADPITRTAALIRERRRGRAAALNYPRHWSQVRPESTGRVARAAEGWLLDGRGTPATLPAGAWAELVREHHLDPGTALLALVQVGGLVLDEPVLVATRAASFMDYGDRWPGPPEGYLAAELSELMPAVLDAEASLAEACALCGAPA